MNARAYAQTQTDRPLSRVLNETPEDEKWEIIDGALVTQAAANFAHNFTRDVLGDEIRAPFQRGRSGPGGWWIVAEQRFVGPDPELHTLEPDLAGWRKERMPNPPALYPDIAPDWACEVISPQSRRRDRGAKMDAYASLGARWYWMVDPPLRTLEAYELKGGAYDMIAGARSGQAVAAAPFDAISFDLDALWAE